MEEDTGHHRNRRGTAGSTCGTHRCPVRRCPGTIRSRSPGGRVTAPPGLLARSLRPLVLVIAEEVVQLVLSEFARLVHGPDDADPTAAGSGGLAEAGSGRVLVTQRGDRVIN